MAGLESPGGIKFAIYSISYITYNRILCHFWWFGALVFGRFCMFRGVLTVWQLFHQRSISIWLPRLIHKLSFEVLHKSSPKQFIAAGY